MSNPNDVPFVPTVTDELAGALALLLGAVDDQNDLHKVVLKRTAVEVARIALAHYRVQQDKGGQSK